MSTARAYLVAHLSISDADVLEVKKVEVYSGNARSVTNTGEYDVSMDVLSVQGKDFGEAMSLIYKYVDVNVELGIKYWVVLNKLLVRQ